MTTVTVSAKIDAQLRKRMVDLGIRPSEVIKVALERAVEEKAKQLMLERANRVADIAHKISAEDWTRAVRGSRDERR